MCHGVAREKLFILQLGMNYLRLRKSQTNIEMHTTNTINRSATGMCENTSYWARSFAPYGMAAAIKVCPSTSSPTHAPDESNPGVAGWRSFAAWPGDRVGRGTRATF